MKYITRTTQKIVLPEGEPIFCEGATTIEISDEAAGEFVTVSQDVDGKQALQFDGDEWPTVRAAIDDMLGKCKEEA